ncbi:MAG: M1 family metallopeptidase [Ignavibacteriae bacterium]|nr:M1 family metallopeptidase [Ignavibacteriota bacterium]
MKVKKKYFFFGCSTLFFISVVAFIFIIKQNFNISTEDGITFVENGFRFNPSQISNIEDYISSNQKKLDILHYNIDLELFPEKEEIFGTTIITGISRSKNLDKIELNFHDNFDVSKVELNNKSASYLYDDNKIIISTNQSLIDTFQLKIKYSGTPKSLGFGSFRFAKNNIDPVIYTLNEPIYASTWFPCNDSPSDKVFADVNITCDSALTAVSNGILKSVKSEKGKKTFHWETKYPIATYLIFFAASKYKLFSDYYVNEQNDSMKIEYFVFPEDLEKSKKDFSIHPKAIKFFSQTFGEYPFINEKYGVAEFMWSFGAMENQTITGVGKNFISGSQFFTDLLVHELAHQWWGNAVTLSSWKDIWLNEGFSTYSEALYWENGSGFSSLQSTMKSFLTDFNGTTLYNPENLFDRIIYNKGAWVLHMLRKEIGDENFFKLLKKYYESFKYKNASTNDFIKLAQSFSKNDLTKFFDQWIFKGNGLIEIEYSFSPEGNNTNEILLKVNQVQKGYEEYRFPLEIKFQFENDSSKIENIFIKKRQNAFKFNFDKKVKDLVLDPNGWLAFRSAQILKEK